ncbi:MAG: efflux RND transporter periplasmic adaptor subunit [Bosea sp. (in: a-proteobacteria)]
MKRWIVVAGVVLAAGAAGWVVLRPGTGGASDTPYRTAALDRGQIIASVRATGTLTPVSTVLVGSMLSGQIIEILADYNSQVKANQVVARLNADQIKARRDAAEADLAQSRSELAVRKAMLERSRATRLKADSTVKDIQAQRDRISAQLAEAKRNTERQRELFGRAVGSQQALDTAKTQLDMQTASLASAEAQIASARSELLGLDADVSLAQAQILSAEAAMLGRDAKLKDILIDLERSEIRSPVDGVVVQRQVEIGQTVAASFSSPTLFQIAQDLREIDIYANIDEADVGRLKPGQVVSFTVNAYPARTFEGEVRLVRLGAQTIQNVVTYTAVMRVQNADLTLLPGMTANLQVVTEDRRDVLRVPNAALRFRPVGTTPAALANVSPAEGARPAAPGAGGQQGGAGRALATLRERIDTEIKPTPEQAKAIAAIFVETRSGNRNMQNLSEDERRAAFRAARTDLTVKIAAALDPERRKAFEAMMQAAPQRQQEAPPARIFVLDAATNQPKPVTIRVGPTDGAFTQVVSGDLGDGAQVIVGGGPKPTAAAPTVPASGPGRGPRLF